MREKTSLEKTTEEDESSSSTTKGEGKHGRGRRNGGKCGKGSPRAVSFSGEDHLEAARCSTKDGQGH